MIRFFLFLLFLANLPFNNLNDQEIDANIQVNYTIYANTESPRVLGGYIEANSHQSYYATYFNTENNTILSEEDDGINIQLGSKPQIIYSNFKDSLLFATKNFRGKNYKIKEQLPKLKWNITSESKLIGDFTCFKALTEFRGRKYEAWFTEEIPLPVGPYKFNGLPGLILEIYDETKRFHWIVNEFKKNNELKKSLEQKFNDNDNNYVDISIKDFVELTSSSKLNLGTKLPRGMTAEIDYKSDRNGIELIYEWEEESNNKD